MGWSYEECRSKALLLQAGRSRLTINYWSNKGFTKTEAIDTIKKIQS
jgi:hypothetical protein